MQFDHPIDLSWLSAPAIQQITHVPVALGTNNLGDDIQSLAASQLFKVDQWVTRDLPQEWPKHAVVPLCGWFGWGELPARSQAIIVGYHCAARSRRNTAAQADWLRTMVKDQGFPAMCRDIATRDLLRSLKIDAEFGGCVTLHLPRYDGPRGGGLLSVDDLSVSHAKRATQPTQLQQRLITMGAEDRLALARERVDLLAHADEVDTSRLHVWLPCLALNTPVKLKLSFRVVETDRFSGYRSQT